MFQLTVAIIKHFQKNFIEIVIDFLNYLEFKKAWWWLNVAETCSLSHFILKVVYWLSFENMFDSEICCALFASEDCRANFRAFAHDCSTCTL